MKRCTSVHIWSDAKCIREEGHDGYCYCKAVKGSGGTFTRIHWWSKNGKFKSHHWYETLYPTNAKAVKGTQ
jgi:hypothetical protein